MSDVRACPQSHPLFLLQISARSWRLCVACYDHGQNSLSWDSDREKANMDAASFREIFSESARLQRYLDAEAALAQAQAKLSVIPKEAADQISNAARLERIDRDRLDSEIERTGHSFAPLVAELSRVVGGAAGGWVHWGATTQNIVQTGDTVGLRLAEAELVGILQEIVHQMSSLADQYADTLMAGRTHQQHAVPITFGFKVAAWIDVLVRDLERFAQCRPRMLVAMAGGAAGTFATLGPVGPAVQDEYARLLGLGSMSVPSRSIVDHLVEFVCLLGLVASTAATIAEECARLMSIEFGEVAEILPDDNIGSSTMPQKRNPKSANAVIIASARVRAMVPLALDSMIQSHEVDGSRSVMLDHALRESCIQMFDTLSALRELMTTLEIFPDRMRNNLRLSHGLISAEAVMMRLGLIIGRQEAHSLIHDVALKAKKLDKDFFDVLCADQQIANTLTRSEVTYLLNPVNHIGLSAKIAHDASRRARAYLAELA